MNIPFQRAETVKNADGSYTVRVYHSQGVYSEANFPFLAHSRALAEEYAEFKNRTPASTTSISSLRFDPSANDAVAVEFPIAGIYPVTITSQETIQEEGNIETSTLTTRDPVVAESEHVRGLGYGDQIAEHVSVAFDHITKEKIVTPDPDHAPESQGHTYRQDVQPEPSLDPSPAVTISEDEAPPSTIADITEEAKQKVSDDEV
jgi:hypothetical protein